MHTAPRATRPPTSARGFSLMELMVTLIIFSLLAGAIVTVLIVSSKQKAATTNEVNATEMGRTGLDMVTKDLRSAGFGIDHNATTPQPAIAYVDSMQILINCDATPYPDTSATARGIPLAYNPAGSPKPKPFQGTSWTPPVRYITGAETIRWTLDLNNDGVVDAADLGVADAADANRTPNPNDFELCREVWGDSTAGTQGNNGGTRERIALIKKPCGSNPPLFRVYMEGDTQPWNWANGPVPANRLQEIVRVEVNVVATSATKNFLGQYSDTKLTTTVNEIRNSPNFQYVTYNVSGFVYNDANKNKVLDGGEAGVQGARVSLGSLSMVTSSTGGFSFDVPPGTYVLDQDPPANYGVFTTPDSFIVTVGPNTTANFADTLRAGGWVTLTVYNDVDKNKSYGGSDTPMQDQAVTLGGHDEVYSTDTNGQTAIFAPVGAYSITTAVPDSFITDTPNPVTGSMTNGGSQTKSIGMYVMASGTVAGTVYNDQDGDGTQDGGDKGVPNAYVSCTLGDGTLIYCYSDRNGKYSLKLPVNDPPKTDPYTINCAPPDGYTSGATLTLTGVFVQLNKTLSGQDFSLGKFTVWAQDVAEPFSAVSAISTDFIENDWTGTQTKHARQDLDFITGTDEGASSNVQQWFNQYDKTPIFHNTPDVNRSAANSVYALAVDTVLAGTGGVTRPDIITGMRYRPTGNWSIWFTQSTPGNEGIIPATPNVSYLTSDNGDVSSIVTYPATTGSSPDILVGTRSPVSGQGVIETWTSASHTNPAYTRAQAMPSTGSIPGNNLGEIGGMAIAEIDNNAAGPELVVGTLTGYYSGQVMVFKKVSGNWVYDWGTTLASDAITALTIADVNGDGKKDIVVGTQSAHNKGHLIWFQNKGGNPLSFAAPVIKNASGIITSLNHADYGTDGIDDILVGWRDTDVTFGGGIEIWYTTTKTLPNSGNDASDGVIKNWVTGIDVGNFNYGVWPQTPTGTPLLDVTGVCRKDVKNGKIFTLFR